MRRLVNIRTQHIGFIVVLIFAALFRSVELINRNYLFGFDQGWVFILAQSILHGKLTLIGAPASPGSGFSGIFHGPGYVYMTALTMLFSRGDPYGSLLCMWLLSMSGFIILYLLSRKILDGYGSWIFVLAIAASGAIVSQARFLWPPHPVLSIFSLVLCSLYLYMHTTKRIYMAAAFFLTGCIYNFHLSMVPSLFIALIIFYIYFNVFLRRGSKKIISMLGEISLYMSVFLINFLPAFLFEMRHGYMFLSSLNQVSHEKKIALSTQVIRHFHSYWTNFLDTFNIVHYLPSPYLISAFVVISLVGVWSILRAKKDTKSFVGIFLLYYILSNYIVFFFVKNTIWGYYLLPLHIAYLLIFSFGIQHIFLYIKNKRHKKILFSLLLLFLYGYDFTYGLYTMYRVELYDHGGTAKILGKKELLDFVYTDANQKPFSISVFTPPVYEYAYTYMFDWYGRKTYGYTPTMGLHGVTYLLIEPDSDKPWSYKGWLETVIGNTGMIEWTKTLPSGYIVQKRIYPETK